MAASFKDSCELHGNTLKLWIQEAITQDHVMQEEEKKKLIQIIASVAKLRAPAEAAARSLEQNVKEAF